MAASRILTISAITLALALATSLIYPRLIPSEGKDTGAGIEATTPANPSLPRETIQVQNFVDQRTMEFTVESEKAVESNIPTGDTTIHGWVGNVSGAGLPGIEIMLESRGFDGEEITVHDAVSNQRGEFFFDQLVPGRQYRLEIKAVADYAGFSLDSVTTGSSDKPGNIMLEPVELIDIDGMIVDTDQAPVANFELSVRNLDLEYPDRIITSDSSGYFKLAAFPAGALRIATNASDYYRIKGLELKPDEYRNLTLVIDRGNYYLSGWVSDNNDAPLHGAQVTLKSAFAGDGYHSFSYRSTVTDENGSFAFAELGGNKLTIGVYAQGFQTHVQQYEFKSFADNLRISLDR